MRSNGHDGERFTSRFSADEPVKVEDLDRREEAPSDGARSQEAASRSSKPSKPRAKRVTSPPACWFWGATDYFK